MQPPPAAGPLPAVSWSVVLASVEEAVSRAVAEVTERARTLEVPAEPPGQAEPEQALAQARQRGLALSSKADGAAARVADKDAALAEAEAALRRWLGQAEAAREKLAAWVGRAVG
jgi:hypothetical protein